MKTCDTPSDEIERSSSMPLIVLTAPSILSVISVSTSSGAAPGRRVVGVEAWVTIHPFTPLGVRVATVVL